MRHQNEQTTKHLLATALAGRQVTLRGLELNPAQQKIVLEVIETLVSDGLAFTLIEDECVRALADAGLLRSNDSAGTRRMCVIYVAGPYRAPTRKGVEQNIEAAADVGLQLASMGYSPLIPHMNTALMDEALPMGDEFWLQATMELMRRCDGVVLVPGWERSEGTLGEICEAYRLGLPVYTSINEMPAPHAHPTRLVGVHL